MKAMMLTLACAALPLLHAAAVEWKPPAIPTLRPAPRWEKVLRNQVRYLLKTVARGGTSRETGERVRELSATAASVATCVRFGACEASPAMRQSAVDILRTVGSTYNVDWGHDWMSAFYAWQAALGAWLLWDDLPADVRSALDAMVVGEADRFLELPAPYSRTVDTKGEENAWNSLLLVFASEVLSPRPHTARWRERAREYMVSAFARPRDGLSDKPVDGRPLRQWVRGANAHEDFTLENHGIVHPDYYLIGPAMSLPSAIVYRLLKANAPEALSHNVREIYGVLKLFCLPGGDLLYPNGTDRTPHRLEMTATLHALMERLYRDRDAGALAEDALTSLEKMQARNPDGRTYMPGEFDHQKPAEGHAGLLYSCALMCAKLWDAPPGGKALDQVWRDLEGPRVFEDGRFLIMRTAQSVSSFAWGSRLMGQTAPFRKERIVNPLPLSYVGLASDFDGEERRPARTGIGSEALANAVQREAIHIQTVIAGQESGAAHVTLRVNHGGRNHVFSFAALPGGKSIYIERWAGGGGALGGLVSFLEEPGWIYGAPARKLQGDGSTWLSVDDHLGFSVFDGGGIRIRPEVRSVLASLNTSSRQDTIIVTLSNTTAAAARELASRPCRVRTDVRDVVGVVLDGFLVASNLGPNPASTNAELGGRSMVVHVNGYATRVLKVDWEGQ